MAADEGVPRRIVSLDQFRGYTVVGMLLVNFLGGYLVVPRDPQAPQHVLQLRRHDHAAVLLRGGVRLSADVPPPAANRRLRPAAAAAAIRRNLGLILLGFVLYHLDGNVSLWAELEKLVIASASLRQAFRRELFQTLVHIAITSIWVLPVIAAGTSAHEFSS